MKPMECKLNWVILRNVESNETKIQSQNKKNPKRRYLPGVALPYE